MIPMMRRRGYKPGFAAGLIASAGVIGPIIPPSIPMVLYGTIAGVSIGQLFLGGIIPGIAMGLGLMLVVYFMWRRKDFPKEEVKPSLRAIGRAFVPASGALVMPFIIVGGILSGVFTATEAAVVAAVYSFVVGVFVYRELNMRDIPEILFRSSVTTAMVLIIVGVPNLVSFVLAMNQIPQAVATYFASTFATQAAILVVINILLLIVGCFIDGGFGDHHLHAGADVPLVNKMGIDPVFFGVMMTINLMIGTITPPVGLSLYVAGGVARLNLEQMSRAVLPFLALEIGVLALVMFFPQIILVLPQMFR